MPPARVYGLLTRTTYDVGHRLGSGAAGVVHASLCGTLALKFYPAPLTEVQAARVFEWVRLVRAGFRPDLPEGDMLCVPVDAAAEAPGGAPTCVVSPLAGGTDLDALLDAHRSGLTVLSDALLARMALGVARNVAAVHALGPPAAPLVVLRDEKTANYRADPATGRVWRIDTEDVSMRPVRLASGAVTEAEGEHTTAGSIPPAELQANATGAPYRATHSDDLFALGVALFRVLHPGWHPTEPRPGPGAVVDPDQAVYDRHYPKYGLGPRAVPAAVAARALPPAVEALFLRCFLTASRPTAAEWAEVLGRWLADLPALVAPAPARTATLWRRVASAISYANTAFAAHVRAACFALVLAAAGAVGLWAHRQAEGHREKSLPTSPPPPVVTPGQAFKEPETPLKGDPPRRNPDLERICERYGIEQPGR